MCVQNVINQSFGTTTRAINGRLECDGANHNIVKARVITTLNIVVNWVLLLVIILLAKLAIHTIDFVVFDLMIICVV